MLEFMIATLPSAANGRLDLMAHYLKTAPHHPDFSRFFGEREDQKTLPRRLASVYLTPVKDSA